MNSKKSIEYCLLLSLIVMAFLAGQHFQSLPKELEKPIANSDGIQRIKLVDFDNQEIDWGYPSPKQITLANLLSQKGVNLENISHFKLIGDESSYTSGLSVIVKDPDEIGWVWDMMFETAEPYSFWLPSGYRKMNIFIKGNNAPAASLYANETDATSINGVDGRFMCRGLAEYIVKKLKKSK